MTDQEPKLWSAYRVQICRICNQTIPAGESAYAYVMGQGKYAWEHKVCKETAIDRQGIDEEMLNRIIGIEKQVDALYHRFFDKAGVEVTSPPKVV